MTQRIALITIVVPDYDAGLAFYRDIMGWDLVADEDQGRKRWVVVSPGSGPNVLLAQASTPAQTAATGNQTGGRVGFFLHTDDFEADHARLSTAGVVFHEQPRHEPYGTVAVFADPWGNMWDLLQPKA